MAPAEREPRKLRPCVTARTSPRSSPGEGVVSARALRLGWVWKIPNWKGQCAWRAEGMKGVCVGEVGGIDQGSL